MDELVKFVSQRTGLSEPMARQAAVTVLEFLKDRLPAPIPGQIEAFLDSPGGKGDVEFDDLIKGLGGMLDPK
jgi:uncharacterized protein (DUF2267 family)